MTELNIDVMGKVNNLRTLGLQGEISLPQIAAIGDQSAGKSALLEYLSNVTFPKGIDMCTTFATQVIMRPGVSFSARVYLASNPAPNLRMPESSADVARVIEEVKATMPPGISQDILTVEITDKDYPMLTLVDIPGFVHCSVDGQSDTIGADIEAIVDKYISDKRTIILAVIPANKDVATNVVLSKAAKYDPDGQRTMGVVTKPDLMDAGTERIALSMLNGTYKKLRLGYHIVRNRNYEEVMANMTHKKAMLKERAFFEQAPWNQISRSDCGIATLKSKLVHLLQAHIRRELPSVQQEILARSNEIKAELERLGPSLTPENQLTYIANNAAKFSDNWSRLINGHYASIKGDHTLYIRAQQQELNQGFYNQIIDSIPKTLDHNAVHTLIRQNKGRELNGIVQFDVFVLLVRDAIKDWDKIAARYIEQALQLFSAVSQRVNERFTDAVLIDSFKTALSTYRNAARVAMLEDLRCLFADEQDPMTYTGFIMDLPYKSKLEQVERMLSEWVNQGSVHKDCVIELRDSIAPPEKHADKDGAANVETYQDEVQTLITNVIKYCDIAAKRFGDAVCMYVVERRLIQNSYERLRNEFFKINPGILSEAEHVTERRKYLDKTWSAMQQALDML
ncbi:hypothetical protein RI367_002038 [Sorochytrium milnesiophthora]